MDEVRVRFAPSPTGSPHIGSMRTAVFNWLFARHNGGKFILRIEDTDRTRLVPGSVEEIENGLRWLGVDWDEGPGIGGPYGPYVQSERAELYRQHAQELVDKGKAYYCFCTPERLTELRKEQEAKKEQTGYDRRCRDLSSDEIARLKAESPAYVIRFKMPLEGTTSFNDLVRGEISFDNTLQDDFVILKSDGFPTYHFANIVDDHYMRISHVIRAEEWISSTPKHVRLYEAFDWQPPLFAHPSLIIGRDKAKLSKRHGAVAFGLFIEQGYLPETILNFLALLGWSAGEDRDLYSAEDLITKFSLEGISTHPAVFDYEKLLWMNGQYIRMCEFGRFVERTLPYLQHKGLLPESPTAEQRAYAEQVLSLYQNRIDFLSDVEKGCDFFFQDQLPGYIWSTEKALNRHPHVQGLLLCVAEALESLGNWDLESIEGIVRNTGAELGLQGGDVIHPIRAGVTGRTAGPGLFEIIKVLGREKTVAHLRDTVARLSSGQIEYGDSIWDQKDVSR